MLLGFITELDFDTIEREFPGIFRLYRQLRPRPQTFLELFWAYVHRPAEPSSPVVSRPPLRVPAAH
jgi:hypothetical protein